MENSEQSLTLETLPKAFSNLSNEVGEIKKLLLDRKGGNQLELEQWFDLNELCIYHPDKPCKPTVYGWVKNDLIPFHKGSKKLRFLKSEIDNWLKEGKKKSKHALISGGEMYLKKKGVNNE